MLKILTPHNPNFEKNKEYLFTIAGKWHWFEIAYPKADYKDFLKYVKTKECSHCGGGFCGENGRKWVKNKVLCSDCVNKYY